MRNVPSKRREMNYSATDNNNTEDMNSRMKAMSPTAIRVFVF